MNTITEDKHGYNAQIANYVGSEVGKASDGGTPSKSLLRFLGATVPTVSMSGETSKTKSIEAIDGGAPTPELRQMIREANLLVETVIESQDFEADTERILQPSPDSITEIVESIDGGQCPNFNF